MLFFFHQVLFLVIIGRECEENNFVALYELGTPKILNSKNIWILFLLHLNAVVN